MIRAVLFDRDGVLARLDFAAARAFFGPLLPISLGELAQRWQQHGEQIGFPRDLAAEQTFWQQFWEKLSSDFNLAPAVQDQLQQFDYATLIRPFPDARPALLEARRHGLRTGVLSNFALASLDASLVAAGLSDLVDSAGAAPVIGAAKPEAAAYRYMLAALHVDPEECLFFDDEWAAVEGARALGLPAYLVARNRDNHLLGEGIVRDLSVLPQILQLLGTEHP